MYVDFSLWWLLLLKNMNMEHNQDGLRCSMACGTSSVTRVEFMCLENGRVGFQPLDHVKSLFGFMPYHTVVIMILL